MTEEKVKPRPRRRRRWLRRLVVFGLVAAISARLLLAMLLPWLTNLAIGSQFDVRWESASLSLLSLHARLHDVELRLADQPVDSNPVVTITDIEVDLATLQLVRGNIDIQDVRILGLHAELDWYPDGSFVLHGAPHNPTPDTATSAGADKPTVTPVQDSTFHLQLPFVLQRADVHEAHLVVHDQAKAGATREWSLDGSARNLGKDDVPAPIHLRITSPGRLEQLVLDANVTTAPQHASGNAQLRLQGLRPDQFEHWLLPLGIAGACTQFDTRLEIDANLKVPDANGPLAVQAHASLHAGADRAEQLVIEELHTSAQWQPSGAITDTKVEAKGIRADAARQLDGTLLLCGLQFSAGSQANPEPKPAHAAAQPSDSGGFAIESLKLADSRLTWTDAQTDNDRGQPIHLTLRLDEASAGPWATASIQPTRPTNLHLRGGIPDIVRNLEITGDNLTWSDSKSHVTGHLSLLGVNPDKLRPLLRPLSLEPMFTDGCLTCRFDGSLEQPKPGKQAFDLALHDLELRADKREFKLATAAISDALFDADQHRLSLGSIELDGPDLDITRRSDGSLELLGFRMTPQPQDDAPTAIAATNPPADGDNSPPLRIELPKFHWHDAHMQWLDEKVSPAQRLQITDVQIHISQYVITGATADDPTSQVRIQAHAGDLCKDLRIEGAARPDSNGITVDLQIDLQGIDMPHAEAYLTPVGLASELEDGSLRTHVTGSFHQTEAGTQIDCRLQDFELRQQDEVLLAATNASVEQLRIDTQKVRAKSVDLQALQGELTLRSDGSLQLPGLRLLPSPATDGLAKAEPQTPAPQTPAPKPAQTDKVPVLRIDKVTGSDLHVVWHNEASGKTRSVDAKGDLSATPLEIGHGAQAHPFSLHLSFAERLDKLHMEGSLGLDFAAPSIDAQLNAAGLDGARCDDLLPAGVALEMEQGQLAAHIDAALQLGEDNLSGHLHLTDLALLDGERELGAIGDLQIQVPEMSESMWHLARLTSKDVRTQIERRDLDTVIAGVRLAAREAIADTQPPAPPTATPPESLADAIPELRPWPRLRIDQIDLECNQLTLATLTDPKAEPLQAQFRLLLPEPWERTGDKMMAAPGLPMKLTATVQPLCDKIEFDTTIFALQLAPRIEGALHIEGIDTEALPRVFPQLANRLSGEFKDGSLTTSVDAEFHLHRTSSMDLSLMGPFGVDLRIDELSLVDDDGTEELGIDALDLELTSVNPVTGELGIQQLEIERPSLRIRRSSEGLRLLGLLLPDEPEKQPGAAPGAEVAAEEEAPASALAIEELVVAGLSLDYRDETTTPITLLPINGLDLEVHHFRSPATANTAPLTFSANLRGGDIPLPKRSSQGALLTRVISELITSSKEASTPQLRPIVEEIALTGSLQLVPVPRGRIRADVRGFELQALRGLANENSITIQDGVFDGGMAAHLRGSQGTDVLAELLFDELSLTEPAGGPISRYLALPSTLDSVLFALRNSRGQIDIPLDFSVPVGGLTSGQVQSQAISAFSRVVVDAIANVPLRAVNAAARWLSGWGSESEDLSRLTTTLVFPAGSAVLPEDPAKLQPLIKRVASDQDLVLFLETELGRLDLKAAAMRANPPIQDLHAVVAHLRQERAKLEVEHQQHAARLQGLFAAGQALAAQENSEKLQQLDARIGENILAQQHVLRQLRPGADRSSDRRTHRAATEIAFERMRITSEQLKQLLPKSSQNQIELSPAHSSNPNTDYGQLTISVRRRLANQNPYRRRPVSEMVNVGDGFGKAVDRAFERHR